MAIKQDVDTEAEDSEAELCECFALDAERFVAPGVPRSDFVRVVVFTLTTRTCWPSRLPVPSFFLARR